MSNTNSDIKDSGVVGAEATTTSPSTTVTPGGTSNTNNSPKITITINGNDRSMELNDHDVVCEKGRGDHERWPGNKLYRHLINVHKETYNDSTSDRTLQCHW